MTSMRLPEQNQVLLTGRLTRDPELLFTQKGQPVCRFDIAANRRFKDAATGTWKDDVTYVPVVVWAEAGERCKEKLRKGSPVHVEGRLKGREYEDKSGQKRKVLEVVARRVQFLEVSPASASTGRAPASGGRTDPEEQPVEAPRAPQSASGGREFPAEISETPAEDEVPF